MSLLESAWNYTGFTFKAEAVDYKDLNCQSESEQCKWGLKHLKFCWSCVHERPQGFSLLCRDRRPESRVRRLIACNGHCLLLELLSKSPAMWSIAFESLLLPLLTIVEVNYREDDSKTADHDDVYDDNGHDNIGAIIVIIITVIMSTTRNCTVPLVALICWSSPGQFWRQIGQSWSTNWNKNCQIEEKSSLKILCSRELK